MNAPLILHGNIQEHDDGEHAGQRPDQVDHKISLQLTGSVEAGHSRQSCAIVALHGDVPPPSARPRIVSPSLSDPMPRAVGKPRRSPMTWSRRPTASFGP